MIAFGKGDNTDMKIWFYKMPLNGFTLIGS